MTIPPDEHELPPELPIGKRTGSSGIQQGDGNGNRCSIASTPAATTTTPSLQLRRYFSWFSMMLHGAQCRYFFESDADGGLLRTEVGR